MSLFGSILEKLGLKKKAVPPPPKVTPTAPAPTSAPVAVPVPPPPPPKPEPMAMVDVVSMLEGWAAQTPQKLNWRTSIVDLMKLLGMESSLTQRKELATELGCPAEYMHDSARMNVWLHKEVLRQIAENGGNVPAELYD
jgi:hypothetical protein